MEVRDHPGVEGKTADSPFAELCGVHIGQAWGMASRLTTCSADADDVMQDALVVAWTKRAMIPQEPWPWFCAVIVNCARNHQRKNARVRPMPYIDPDSSADVRTHPERVIQVGELRAEIHAALRELSPEEHEAVALCVLGGLTQAEASKATGANINTIKARVRRGTERLREKLKHRPNGLQAFLALPALPHPSGGLESAVTRWVSVAKKGGPTSYIPKLSAGQIAVATCMLVVFAVVMVALAFNPPPVAGSDAKVGMFDDKALEPETPQPSETGPLTLDDDEDPTSARSETEGSETLTPDTTEHEASKKETVTEDKTDSGGTSNEALLPVSDKYPTGEPRSVGTAIKTEDGLILHGKWETRFPDGAVLETGQFKLGKKEGVWTSHHPNGAKSAEGRYTNDEKDGLWQYFYENGAKQVEGEYVNGKKSGTWYVYYPSGNLLQIETRRNGERQGWYRRFSSQGVVVLEAEYVSDLKNGRQIEYDPATRLPRRESTYQDGVKRGIELDYDPLTGLVVASRIHGADK